MRLTHRPLVDQSWCRPAHRERSRFTASWSDTLALLEREVYALQDLDQDDPVIMLGLTESQLRLDGQPRASAIPDTPAVALSFQSRRGPLMFRCDRHDQIAYGASMKQPWQHNVRAIAMTLEALRAVDRYGATQSGEQYTGYKALGPGQSATGATPAPMSVHDALRVLAEHSTKVGVHPDDLREHWAVYGAAARAARRATHPDLGGNTVAWTRVSAAIDATRHLHPGVTL